MFRVEKSAVNAEKRALNQSLKKHRYACKIGDTKQEDAFRLLMMKKKEIVEK